MMLQIIAHMVTYSSVNFPCLNISCLCYFEHDCEIKKRKSLTVKQMMRTLNYFIRREGFISPIGTRELCLIPFWILSF